jgi:enoyl-CoA hydratase/carnithine racemase
LYEGTLINAEEALQMGLIDVIYPPDRIHKEVEVYAEALANKPAQALAAIRRTIMEGGALSFEKGMEIEFESAANLAGTRDFSEGIKAFLEKRKPDWD